MELNKKSKTVKHSDNVLEFITKDKNFSIIWFSDAHIDSLKSKTDWMHKVLKDNPDSYIIMGGDNHDLMQAKGDKRGSKSQLAPELKGDNYWNLVIEQTRKTWVEPYKDRIIAWLDGNHTSSVMNHQEIDFIGWLTDGDNGERLYTAGYLHITHDTNTKSKNAGFPIYFQHAPTSGGKRSKGMLSCDILLGEHPNVKAIITEHIHETFITPQTVESYDAKNKKITYQNVWYIQAPTCKAEHEGKKIGFFTEKVKKAATTIGAVKLNFSARYNKQGNCRLDMQPEWILFYD